ncbi:hypothetical protein Pcinc_013276 [Petrolisthes cinctipes]|uniref:Uncharacterized protein n=1 Tax=Petrolisthes cinctipes TaxID=88211 RepID=A0AAE1FXR0_PETCI|nr:hypothetical protein Pcinc_013276 [Petrolisthes cinctipes]
MKSRKRRGRMSDSREERGPVLCRERREGGCKIQKYLCYNYSTQLITYIRLYEVPMNVKKREAPAFHHHHHYSHTQNLTT